MKFVKNKVVLIRPENSYNFNNYPPLNLICLGSVLKSSGYNVQIINCSLENNPLEKIKNEIQDALFVGITLLTPEVPDAYNVIKFIKKNSDIPIVVGGWHCTLFPEQMAELEDIDYVIVGEGEEHIIKIASLIQNNEVCNNKIFKKQIIDLDTLPCPDYSLDSNIEKYIKNYLTDPLSAYIKQPMRWLPYETSRGCPSKCAFCINVVTNNRQYRKKSAMKVISEIECLVKKYQISHLKIIDDNFFVDIKRVQDICEGIIKKGLNITWDAECRCDYFNDRMINDSLLSLAKNSGLVQLTLGIESGSLHTLKIMRKGITTEQAEYAVKKCDEYQIIARSSVMIEVPGENIEDIKQTIKFVGNLKKYPYFSCGIGTFRPYPKCELSQVLLDKGYLTEPKTIEEWTQKDIIDMYTSSEYKQPWQIDSDFSVSAAYFINMEFSTRLRNSQIDRIIDKLINNIFINLAKIRNRFMFYKYAYDVQLYKKFLVNFYSRRCDLERGGAYPISDIESNI